MQIALNSNILVNDIKAPECLVFMAIFLCIVEIRVAKGEIDALVADAEELPPIISGKTYFFLVVPLVHSRAAMSRLIVSSSSKWAIRAFF